MVLLGGIRLVLPTPPIVELHPVVFSILDFSGILQGLGEQVPQVVVVWGVLETQIADVAQVLVELLCALSAGPAILEKKGCVLPGYPSHRSLIAVVCFFSPIFSYFCLLVAAFRPCHGRPPLRKYMKTCPNASRSSRRDCSRPRCVLILM